MKRVAEKNKCRSIRSRMLEAAEDFVSLDAAWVQNHVAGCARCRRRLAGLGKVLTALTLMKSNCHDRDLLGRANEQAVGVLRRDLRETTQAQRLRASQMRLGLYGRLSRFSRSAIGAAACLAILLLARFGVFSSMRKAQDQGHKMLHDHYAMYLDEEMTDDIFA